MDHRLVVVSFFQKRAAEVFLGRRVVGLELHGGLNLVQGGVHVAALEEDEAEIVVGEKGAWIFDGGGAPERFGISIDRRLFPRQNPERRQQRRGEQRLQEHSPVFRKSPPPRRIPGRRQRNRPDDGKILPVVRHQ